jgi:hypothetical protein
MLSNKFIPLIIIFFIGISFYFNKHLGFFIGFLFGILYPLYKTFKEPFVSPLAYDDTNYNDEDATNNIIYGDGSEPKVYISNQNSVIKNPWSEKVIKEFLNVQATQNPNVIFDLNMIQLQATEAEAEVLIKTGRWPWSKRTQDIYMDAISRNNITKNGPLKSMNYDRTIYNENIVLQMIALNENEGQFLIYGGYVENPNARDPYDGRGNYGVNSGLINTDKDLVKCNRDKLIRIHSLGNDGITGVHLNKITELDYNQLPTLINGFKFLDKPCNPCTALDATPNYKCPFSLDGGKKVSFAWQKLWGLSQTPIPKMPAGFPYWFN